jgi:hypothetical protein
MTPRTLKTALFGLHYGVAGAALAALLLAGSVPSAVNSRPFLRTVRNSDEVADKFHKQLRKLERKEHMKDVQRKAFSGEG